jgi:hypothetical protein
MTWISALWTRGRRQADEAARLAEAIAEERRHPAHDVGPPFGLHVPFPLIAPPLPYPVPSTTEAASAMVRSWRRLCGQLAQENARLRERLTAAEQRDGGAR